MRKIIIFFIGLVFLASCDPNRGLKAQDVTRNANKTYRVGYTQATYDGVLIDTLTDNQDTIDVVFNMRVANGQMVKRVVLATTLDTIGGSDSICAISLLAEDFDGDTYSHTVIASSNTAEITVSDVYTEDVSAYTEAFLVDTTLVFPNPPSALGDTLLYSATITPVNNTYRKYVARLIYKGDFTGDGLKIDKIELKLWTN